MIGALIGGGRFRWVRIDRTLSGLIRFQPVPLLRFARSARRGFRLLGWLKNKQNERRIKNDVVDIVAADGVLWSDAEGRFIDDGRVSMALSLIDSFLLFFFIFFAGAAGGKEFIFVFSSLTDLISASALT